jgi:hypothetical protein
MQNYTKTAVVTFANGNYLNLVKRQENEFKKHLDCDYFCFTDFSQVGSPSHIEHPYAFKPYSIKKVLDLGYTNILWADSPVYAISNVSYILEHIKREGILLIDNIGFSVASHTNDNCLNYYDINREQAKNIPMVMACFMAFNFTNFKCINIFNEYYQAATNGTFVGSWDNHRHDQSVISIISHNHEISLQSPEKIIYYHNEPNHTWRNTPLISKRIL